MKNRRSKSLFPTSLSALKWLSLALLLMSLLTGCEAPLILDGVNAEKAKSALRFDRFQAAAQSDSQLVVVGAMGVVVTSTDGGKNWQRQELPGNPALIDVARCGDDRFVALEIDRNVWISDAEAKNWQKKPIETQETPLAMTCAPDGKLWVVGSFSTIMSSADMGGSWKSTSLDEDLMFTTVQFLDEQFGVATGEFGTVVMTRDGGENWESQEPLPNEFYPLAALFTDAETGWVSGLNGAILHTADGSQTWEKQSTPTKTPLYGLSRANGAIVAVGDHGTLIQLAQGQWEKVSADTKTLSYFRDVLPVAAHDLLLIGGGGAISRVQLNGGHSSLATTNGGGAS